MKKYSVVGLFALCGVLSLWGCGGSSPKALTPGSAHVVARGQALTADVARVQVTVSAADLSTPITYNLTKDGTQWEGVVANIPAGSNRTFDATAYDGAGTPIYQGQTSNVTIASGATALVEIVLQEITHQPPHDNAAPVIDGVSVAKDQLALGETVPVTVTAHDPNAGDALTYRWLASDGTFVDPTATATDYTAPSTAGIVTLTIEVSDQDGAKATQSFTLMVGMASAVANVAFNDWPVVQKTAVQTSPLKPGQSTQVTAVAVDGNGDPLSYSWTSTDGAAPCGTFDDAAVATPVFTATSSGGSCTLSVAVSDGQGGTGSGSIQFGIGDAGGVQYGASGPVVVSLFQSTSNATPSQTVTLRIKAQDTSGGAVSFVWANTVGTLALQGSADPAHESEVQWTAPACLAAGESTQLQVAVTDGASHTLTVAFPMSGPGTCMPLVGGVSTADVGTSGAQLVSTTTNVTLAIPAESLSTTTPISVALSGLTAPDAVSPVYDFGPPGTVFAHPITVRVPLPAGATEGNVYWRRHNVDGTPAVDGSGNPIFDNVGGVVEDGFVVAQITHFSEAYVGPVATARTVSGSSVITYAGSSRPILNVPSDYSTQGAPSALVLSGGVYTELPGIGSTDGTFIIPDVPNGEYILRLGSRYVVTSNDSIDLGSHRNGRPDTTPVGPTSTLLTMNFTNASPYAATDLFELVSADSDQCAFDFTGNSLGGPGLAGGGANPGETAFSMSIDFFNSQWCGQNAGRIEGSKGDTAVVGQLVQTVTDSGMPVQLMQQIATLPSFDQVEGSESVVDVALQTLPQGRTANYTILGTQFTRYLLDENGQALPNVVPTNAEVSPYMSGGFTPFVDIEALGGGIGHGMFGNTLDLALASPSWSAGDFSTGTLSYGVPPDGNWGVFTGVRYSLAALVGLPCPDATGCQPDGHAYRVLVRTAGMERQFETALQPTGTVAPLLSPVSAAFVNGASLATRQSGFGTTPTLSWTPPTLGAPDLYRVNVLKLWTQRGPTGQWETWWNTVASISTPHTSVVVPSGILEPGAAYMFSIQALQTGMANPLQAPNRQATNNSWTSILSDVQYP